MDSLENKNLSREGIIVRLAELNLQEEPVERTELDSLKQNFYKLRIAEVETARTLGKVKLGTQVALFSRFAGGTTMAMNMP